MDEALETEDLSQDFRERGVVRRGLLRKINLDLPESVVQRIDRIATKIGVSRQPLLKIWIHERLREEDGLELMRLKNYFRSYGKEAEKILREFADMK